MADQNKQEHKKTSGHPVAAVLTGAVIGAGVAVAGTVALSDKKNRDRVKKVLTNVKDQAMGYMDNLKKQAEEKKREAGKKLIEGKKMGKKVASI